MPTKSEMNAKKKAEILDAYYDLLERYNNRFQQVQQEEKPPMQKETPQEIKRHKYSTESVHQAGGSATLGL